MRRCKDCVAENVSTLRRPALRSDGSPQPGNRCVTHHRAWKRRNRDLAHGRRLESNFGMTSAQYADLLAAQGGKCFICQRATGAARRLAVDHDHRLAVEHGHPSDRGCPRCWRAIVCGPCNQVIGRLGVEALCRAIEVLTDPPARKVLDGG
jgi:hypothetical protein